ncbi:transmembrane and coiled-coil domain containing protein [Paracoccidioides lutzii Pb01]|uniref:Transmembrane and coiled-coil domain containing protein n=1 Tax=Paracoccidioides lutzii (strain ATCC MYA-826 / Pb01) TaxID=502779 RepID=C1H5N9_PARBA|nr:transmembrane and coiled-coil domain containing protein [Paracoccidioides lutzii Pb01]EEH35187.1 transmembrane and coiled-coil domain containing protein [Paracoccidioides lutzii Pb01]
MAPYCIRSLRPVLQGIGNNTCQRGSRRTRRSSSSAVVPIEDPAFIPSKPSWSVKSLLPQNTPLPQSGTVSLKQLHHLLKLSALPPPSSVEEEEEMLKTLESQIHFVREVQRIDTSGITPLRTIRDETVEAQEENTIGIKDLEESLKQEQYVGWSRRIQRTKAEKQTHPDGEVWDGDALKPASKAIGRYFVLSIPGYAYPMRSPTLPFLIVSLVLIPKWPENVPARGPFSSWRLTHQSEFNLARHSTDSKMASPMPGSEPCSGLDLGHGQYQEDKMGGDIATVLSLGDRQSLALLMVDIVDEMQQTIFTYFNTVDSRRRRSVHNPAPDDSDSIPSRSQKAKLGPPTRKPSTLLVKVEAESLRYFSIWKDSVTFRIGEIINTPDAIESLANEPPEGSQEVEDVESTAEPDFTRLRPNRTSFASRYPPVETPLIQLPHDTKLVLLHSVLLLLLSLEHYSAHSRVLMLRMASSLGLTVDDLVNDEIKVAEGLLQTARAMTAEQEAKTKVEEKKTSRKWKIRLASAAGGVLIGLTGGFAAPVVAAGISAVMGGLGLGATAAAGYLGVVASSSTIIGGIFGAFGARMTGKMMERYAKEVEDFAFLPLYTPAPLEGSPITTVPTDQRLRVTIAISGWLSEEEDIVNPWRVLGRDSEVFALRWEFKALMRLGNAMTTVVRHTAWAVATRQAITGTVFAPILGSIMWPVALLKLAHVIDNPFSIAKVRADKAGHVLADALINKAQGERPVTLIGYSLGARVIFCCLLSLAKRRAFGLVESAILIGSPTPSTASHWQLMRTVVSGRLVNVYSLNDAVLGFLYRANSAQYGIAGLQAITGVPGVENFDMSDSVTGHLRYQYMVGHILRRIGYDHLDQEELQRQIDMLKARDEGDKKQLQLEKEKKLGQPSSEQQPQQPPANNTVPQPSPAEVGRVEREVEGRVMEAMYHIRFGRLEVGGEIT